MARRDISEAAEGNAEVQAKVDAAEDKGYFGEVPDKTPNKAYALTSGPDAPPLCPDDRTRFEQPAFPAKKES